MHLQNDYCSLWVLIMSDLFVSFFFVLFSNAYIIVECGGVSVWLNTSEALGRAAELT